MTLFPLMQIWAVFLGQWEVPEGFTVTRSNLYLRMYALIRTDSRGAGLEAGTPLGSIMVAHVGIRIGWM